MRISTIFPTFFSPKQVFALCNTAKSTVRRGRVPRKPLLKEARARRWIRGDFVGLMDCCAVGKSQKKTVPLFLRGHSLFAVFRSVPIAEQGNYRSHLGGTAASGADNRSVQNIFRHKSDDLNFGCFIRFFHVLLLRIMLGQLGQLDNSELLE